jgi:hypothetical protein
MLGLVHYATFPLPTTNSLTILYSALVRNKFKYASATGTLHTDSCKLDRIQEKSAALCYSRFLIGACDNKYNRLNLSALQLRQQLPDALFSLASSNTNWAPHPHLILLVYMYLMGAKETFGLLMFYTQKRDTDDFWELEMFWNHWSSIPSRTYFRIWISILRIYGAMYEISYHHNPLDLKPQITLSIIQNSDITA